MSEKESPKWRVVEASFLASGSTANVLPAPALPEIAFAGRSNVGKSSLMNMLVARNKLVRTSSSPGCTRALNLFHAKLQSGLEVQLVDLPGYGYAKVSRAEAKSWQGMIEGYLQKRPSLVALVLIVDVRRGIEDEERELIEFMESGEHVARSREPVIILCATKLDKLSLSEQKPALGRLVKEAGLSKSAVLGVSAVTGAGRDALWQKLSDAVATPHAHVDV